MQARQDHHVWNKRATGQLSLKMIPLILVSLAILKVEENSITARSSSS